MIRHYDQFNGVRTSSATSGDLDDVSFWDVTGTSALNIGYTESHAYLATNTTEHEARHQTDANLCGGLPGTFTVEATFRLSYGGRVFGLLALGDATPNSANRVRVFVNMTSVDTGAPITFGLNVPGFAEQLWFGPNVGITTTNFDPDDPTIYHRMIMRCNYIGQSTAGNPIYTISLQINNILVFTSAQRELTYWTSSMYHVGFWGRRETTPTSTSGVQSLVACDTFFTSDEVRRDHDPAPTITAAVSRTPIVPEDETPSGTVPTFPFEVKLERVRYVDPHRLFVSQAGYTHESPKQPTARRVFDVAWIGTDTDYDTLQTFFETNNGQHYTITIRPQGIGSVTVQALNPEDDFTLIANNVRSVAFQLVEVA